uniref:Uncharacterized protein n=1 Tax=Arundo donax TaxID=35708 RepID=A0A0A9GHT5_ARUDO
MIYSSCSPSLLFVQWISVFKRFSQLPNSSLVSAFSKTSWRVMIIVQHLTW